MLNNTYKIEISESKKLRRASATIRNGAIQVKLPQRWSRAVKQEITDRLVQRLQDKDYKERALIAKVGAKQPRITIKTDAELSQYVHQLNQATFNFPHLGKIQIGYARYNHLAQVNLRTKTMTVSRFCLENVPALALRYLIVHEMAHYLEAGHNKRFWGLVEKHVPDYRLQSRLIKAFHHQAVMADEAAETGAVEPLPIQTQDIPEEVFEPIYEPDFDFQADRIAEKPVQPKKPEQNKSGSTPEVKPGFIKQFKQLWLWDS